MAINEGWLESGRHANKREGFGAKYLIANIQYYRHSRTKGFFNHKETNKPVTGRIVKMMKGEFEIIFHVKHGVKDGVFKQWHSTDNLAQDYLYYAGVLIRHKVFTTSESQVNRRRDGSPYPWRVILDEWNQDGTPAKPKK